jgi:hypothetical protein
MLKFLERFSFYQAEHEFLYGIVAAALLFLLIKLLFWLLKSRKCPGILLEGQRGNLFITSGAVEDFVIRTLADRDEMVIDKVRLSKKGSNFSIIIYLRVAAETVVTDLRPLIEERVLEHTESRMGIKNIKEVNIILKNFSAKERQIKSRHKLAMKDPSEIEEEKEELEEAPKVF